ncbi:C40 family peptidase [Shewanella sp. ULN5]|uniref:C40 family peptidase n=1 Tax=Shewanella TaxID=22 RepID=UPI0024765207|nr:NlpC/P60 family protein [Shewanella holmiensis]
MIKKLSVISLAILLSACASQAPKVVVQPAKTIVVVKEEPKLPKWSEPNLLAYHDDWSGTPYRLGGMSKNGVDCSGFVYLAYLDIVGQKLPRTVNAQRILGKEVPRNELEIGDLVFFKTTKTARHVGIYMGDSKFLHASTKKGVKISSLNNVYWKPRYWFAKRLESPQQSIESSITALIEYAEFEQQGMLALN